MYCEGCQVKGPQVILQMEKQVKVAHFEYWGVGVLWWGLR